MNIMLYTPVNHDAKATPFLKFSGRLIMVPWLSSFPLVDFEAVSSRWPLQTTLQDILQEILLGEFCKYMFLGSFPGSTTPPSPPAKIHLGQSIRGNKLLGFLKYLFYLFILAVLGLSCGTWDLELQHVDFIVAACGLLSCSIWDLVPQPGIKPGPPALGVQSLTHWTTREVRNLARFLLKKTTSIYPSFNDADDQGFWMKRESHSTLHLFSYAWCWVLFNIFAHGSIGCLFPVGVCV